MREYLIVASGVITNSIVCADAETADAFGALPSYPGAAIGDVYAPPPPILPPDPLAEHDELIAELVGRVIELEMRLEGTV